MAENGTNGNGRLLTGQLVPITVVAGLIAAAFSAGGAWISHSTRVESVEKDNAEIKRRLDRIERRLAGETWKGPF